MKIRFLGTNGWFSTDKGNTVCALIESEKYYVVLDAGDGIHKLDRYIENEKPIHLFLSHLHFDHILGFHQLNKFMFKQTLNVYGLTGTRDSLQIIRHPYTIPFSDLPFQVKIHELQEGRHSNPFPFTCKLLFHSDPCLGYRLELDGKVITYCTDTGVCDSLYELAQDAALLITECSLKPGQDAGGWPHLNPREAANAAKRANAEQLVLTHFDAECYQTGNERLEAETVAKQIFENTLSACDDLEIEL
jgi:ribonuclease BN (tRNA processing enzyme)